MQILKDDGIFEPIRVFDYQAVCYEDKEIDYELMPLVSSALNLFLWSPFKYFAAVLMSLLSTVYALPSYMANRKCFEIKHKSCNALCDALHSDVSR